MNREKLIALAREAGLMDSPDEYNSGWTADSFDEIERFAVFVAAEERKKCAKVCEDLSLAHPGAPDLTAHRCATAIRARGQE